MRGAGKEATVRAIVDSEDEARAGVKAAAYSLAMIVGRRAYCAGLRRAAHVMELGGELGEIASRIRREAE